MDNNDIHKKIIKLALEEDLYPHGDLSSSLLLSPETRAKAQIIAKELGILACSHIIQEVLEEYSNILGLDQNFIIELYFQDCDPFKTGDLIAEIEAPGVLILGAERTILNFLQRFCGIASYTKKLIALIPESSSCKLLDTRKTMPGMRLWEKEAFRCGGGTNHRLNLSDMIMLKENHLALANKDLIQAIKEIREKYPTSSIKIEVEINQENLDKLDAVLNAGVDIIMLDNFAANKLPDLVREIRNKNPQVKIEVSGGVNEENLASYAQTGVDYISTSRAFTHAKNIDLSMMILDSYS